MCCWRSRLIRKKYEGFHTDCLKTKVEFLHLLWFGAACYLDGMRMLNFIEGTVDTNKHFLRNLNRTAPNVTLKKSPKMDEDNNILIIEWVSSRFDLSSIGTLWQKGGLKHPFRIIPELKKI